MGCKIKTESEFSKERLYWGRCCQEGGRCHVTGRKSGAGSAEVWATDALQRRLTRDRFRVRREPWASHAARTATPRTRRRTSHPDALPGARRVRDVFPAPQAHAHPRASRLGRSQKPVPLISALDGTRGLRRRWTGHCSPVTRQRLPGGRPPAGQAPPRPLCPEGALSPRNEPRHVHFYCLESFFAIMS